MALVTEQPEGIATTNALDDIPDDLLQIPPAYLTFSSTPAAVEEPPKQGDVETYLVRARCTAEHGPIERRDGEMRYTRTMAIQAIWKPGQKEPSDDDQPAMFDHGGDPNPDAIADEQDQDDDLDADDGDSEDLEDDSDDEDPANPAFSHVNTDN